MNPGDYNKKVVIEQQTRVADGGGGATVTWSKFADAWVSIRPLSGSERFFAQQRESDISHELRMPYRSGVLPSMRVLYRTRVFYIQAVRTPEEMSAELILDCTEEMVRVAP